MRIITLCLTNVSKDNGPFQGPQDPLLCMRSKKVTEGAVASNAHNSKGVLKVTRSRKYLTTQVILLN